MSFNLNGIIWLILFVDPDSPILIDRTGTQTVACTDPITKRVYISNELRGPLLKRVMIHELGHCIMVSYHLLDDIHRMVKQEYWVEAEEFICNFVANYAEIIFNTMKGF